jgi:hypothetical protein
MSKAQTPIEQQKIVPQAHFARLASFAGATTCTFTQQKEPATYGKNAMAVHIPSSLFAENGDLSLFEDILKTNRFIETIGARSIR